METTKISSVTTVIRVESIHSGYKFTGTAEFYNKAKALKTINCQVEKEGNLPGTPQVPVIRNTYTMYRGTGYSPTLNSTLPDGAEGEAILASGLEFEEMLGVKFAAGILEETV